MEREASHQLPHFVIHIGSHKTGSTYLQKRLCDFEGKLRVANVIYPKTSRDILYGHHSIAYKLNDPQALLELKKTMSLEIPNSAHTVIISSENFEYLSIDEITKLVSLVPNHKVSILYFFRSWGPLIYSMWQEQIKHGETLTFDSFCMEHYSNPENSNILNFLVPLQRYATVVGIDNMVIASYELIYPEQDLFSACMRILSLPTSENIEIEMINQAYNPFLIEEIRTMNYFAIKSGFNKNYLIRHVYVNKVLPKMDLNKQTTLHEHMNECLKTCINLNQGSIWPEFYKKFTSIYSKCLVFNPMELNGKLNDSISFNRKIIDDQYLLNAEVISALIEIWEILKAELKNVLLRKK